MNKSGLLLISVCMLLTACGEPSSPAAPTPPVTQITDLEEHATTEELSVGEEPEQQPDTEQAQPAEQTAERTYFMNRNYMIVPKEDAERKVVLLTFDDGPKEAELLTAILDTLDKHAAKAIFFVNGYRVKQHPELLKLIHERGQTIGNHAWDHVNLKKLKPEEADRQIEDVQRIVEELTGEKPTFFRPPFGAGNDHVKKKAAEEGMLYMTWSNGSQDWVKGYDKPEKVVESVMEQLHPGSNILMHELPWTAEGLDDLLTRLSEKGYGFVDPALIDPDYSKN
ncbi:polysaccharide deacetylase family protein [Paenibacillus alkalitolerans]|uniref:polysaccharide deacetylase family protein n=1 Tax=Paenibacillus alkalitolerans TaxID=2799335 RepID=UPI0018F703BE|nr:polysaccharide deacetylase family protein [Paenibacillus alkalitolerans]